MTSLRSLGPAQILSIAALAVAAALWLSTGPEDILLRTAALSGAAITLFAARVLPETLTAILTFLAFLGSGLVPVEVIFAGFSSSGFWLLFAGLVMGSAITSTGLGRQIALRLFARTGTSYARAVWLLAACGIGLGLLVPSAIPRVVVLLPISVALAEAMGFRAGSRQAIGLSITAACSTLMPTYAFLTANLPIIVEASLLEALYDVTLPYGGYFVQQAPINLVRFVVLVALMLRFAPAVVSAPLAGSGIDAPSPLNRGQTRLLVLLMLAIVLWATDTIHGIAPAWVALSVAALVLWPALGVMDAQAMKRDIDLSPAFFIAGVLCVSGAAQVTGLSTASAEALIPMLGLGEGSALRDLYATTAFTTLVSHLTTAPATPVVLVPLAGSMAEATGWSIETLAMIHALGVANTILPYQAPPLVVAMALAQIPTGALTRICALLGLASFAIGVPITYVWWQWLGVI
jgi:di/tricarboxylate transporter